MQKIGIKVPRNWACLGPWLWKEREWRRPKRWRIWDPLLSQVEPCSYCYYLPTLCLRRVFDLAMQICDTIYHMISLSLSLSNLFYSVFSMFCFVIHFSDSHKPNPHVPFNLYILCNLEPGMEQSHPHNTNHWDFLSHSLFFLSTLSIFLFLFLFFAFLVCVCVCVNTPLNTKPNNSQTFIISLYNNWISWIWN